MTKAELYDRLHYVAGILAMLVIDKKYDEAQPWAKEASDLNAILNQIIPI
jgi:hypothetical protein